MASLGVPAMAAPAGEENCLWSNITPRRSTQYGPVVGLDQGESLVWYGIPYGAAPVGELRWQAPQDPAVWTEAKDCTAPSEVAYQYGSGAIGTEDCLKLDVYTTPNAHKLPVLVFIHGGNNQTGNTKEILGSELVVRDNCVFVTRTCSALSAREATISFCISDGFTAMLWYFASGTGRFNISAVLMSAISLNIAISSGKL